MSEQENTVKLLKQDAKFIKIGQDVVSNNATVDFWNPETSATTEYGANIAIGPVTTITSDHDQPSVAIGAFAKSTGGLALGPYSTASTGQISFGVVEGWGHKNTFTTGFDDFKNIVTGNKFKEFAKTIVPLSDQTSYIDSSKFIGFTSVNNSAVTAYFKAEPITGHIDEDRGMYAGNLALTGKIPVSGYGYTSFGVKSGVKPLATSVGYQANADYCGVAIGYRSGDDIEPGGWCTHGISIGYKSRAEGTLFQTPDGVSTGVMQGIAIGPYAKSDAEQITFSNGNRYISVKFNAFVDMLTRVIASSSWTSGTYTDQTDSDITVNIPKGYPRNN